MVGLESGVVTFLGKGSSSLKSEYQLGILATDDSIPPLHDVAFVKILFDIEPLASSGKKEDGGISVAIPIVLGILSAILIIVIVAMVLYIYRK